MKTLKIIALTCLFSLAFTLSSHAQEKGTSEINLGYGLATSVTLMSTFDDIFNDLFISDQANGGSVGAFFLSYDYAIADRVNACKQHLKHSIEWKGKILGIAEMKRHYSNYFKGIPHFKDYRIKIITSECTDEIFELLDEIKLKF